jgi:hypothetical protein
MTRQQSVQTKYQSLRLWATTDLSQGSWRTYFEFFLGGDGHHFKEPMNYVWLFYWTILSAQRYHLCNRRNPLHQRFDNVVLLKIMFTWSGHPMLCTLQAHGHHRAPLERLDRLVATWLGLDSPFLHNHFIESAQRNQNERPLLKTQGSSWKHRWVRNPIDRLPIEGRGQVVQKLKLPRHFFVI